MEAKAPDRKLSCTIQYLARVTRVRADASPGPHLATGHAPRGPNNALEAARRTWTRSCEIKCQSIGGNFRRCFVHGSSHRKRPIWGFGGVRGGVFDIELPNDVFW